MAVRKTQIDRLKRAIEAQQKKLATVRDSLRDLESELTQLGDDADEADQDLERAIDALSRLQ